MTQKTGEIKVRFRPLSYDCPTFPPFIGQCIIEVVASGVGITVDRITEMGTVVVIMAVVITEVDIMEVVTTEDIINRSDETGEKSPRMVAL